VADVLTKGLSSARFLFLKSKLMVISSPISLQLMQTVQQLMMMKLKIKPWQPMLESQTEQIIL
jgi:hypothetical protein